MMPYVARQRELPHMHPAAGTQLMYHSVPHSPHYRQSQHPLNPRYQLHQDPIQSNRPLFRTQSASSAVPTHHQTQENLLRRKTPSGTLPAAYDAAPMEWTTRPTKQILLPYQPPSNRSVQQMDNVGPQFKTDESWGKNLSPAAGTLRLQGADLSNGNSDMFSTLTGWPMQTNNGGPGMDESLEPSVRQFFQQQQQMVPPIDPMWFSAQPSGFQAMYNPITPPTASCDELNGYLMGGGNFNPIPQDITWHGQYTGWGTGQTTPSQLPQAVNNMKLNVPYTPQPQELHSNVWPQQLPGRDMAAGTHFQQIMTPGMNDPQSAFLPDPSLRPVQLDMLSGMANLGQAHNRLSQPSREKVVSWAHRAYVELLAAIQSQQHHDSQGNSTPQKAGIFPRPPIFHRSVQRSHSTGMIPRAGVGDDVDRRKRARPSMGLTSNYPDIGTSSSHSVTNNGGYPFPNSDLHTDNNGVAPQYHDMNQNGLG
ncbi:hypothetical protein EDC01DRAFT_511346 [Geopyxis carbonaria]|nr:hypothetical protein EDC01DRAFT_511346 [Geopyxis carbonaria]